MNRLQKIALCAAAMAALASPAFAQSSATVSTTGTTKIVSPLSIAQNSALAFGTIVKPGSAGTSIITVSEVDGTRSKTGTAALATSTSSRATYTVTGESGQTFSIGTTALTMTRSGGSETLPVTLVKSGATGTLIGGTATFGVGGSFTVADTTVSGDYTGTFDVTVTYN